MSTNQGGQDRLRDAYSPEGSTRKHEAIAMYTTATVKPSCITCEAARNTMLLQTQRRGACVPGDSDQSRLLMFGKKRFPTHPSYHFNT